MIASNTRILNYSDSNMVASNMGCLKYSDSKTVARGNPFENFSYSNQNIGRSSSSLSLLSPRVKNCLPFLYQNVWPLWFLNLEFKDNVTIWKIAHKTIGGKNVSAPPMGGIFFQYKNTNIVYDTWKILKLKKWI